MINLPSILYRKTYDELFIKCSGLNCADISALVLMLSRPVTKGFMPGWLSAEMDTRLLLVIDNSSSMSAQSDMKSLLDGAKQTANELLDVYGENTTVNII